MTETSALPVEDPGRGEVCVWCGEGEVRQTGVGRRRRYCSAACRQAAYSQRRINEAVAAALAEREHQEREQEM